MAKLFDIMGNFPFQAEDKKPTLIRKSEYSTALYPPNNAFTSDNTFTMITRSEERRVGKECRL